MSGLEKFDGNLLHETKAFRGDRISVVAFAVQNWKDFSAELNQNLEDAGYVLGKQPAPTPRKEPQRRGLQLSLPAILAKQMETKNGPVSDPQALLPNQMLVEAACSSESRHGPGSDPPALLPNQAVLPSVHHPFRPRGSGIANAAITDESAGNVETTIGPVSDPLALQPNQHTVQDRLSVSDPQAMMPNKMLAMAACNREAINGPVSDPHVLLPNQAEKSSMSERDSSYW